MEWTTFRVESWIMGSWIKNGLSHLVPFHQGNVRVHHVFYKGLEVHLNNMQMWILKTFLSPSGQASLLRICCDFLDKSCFCQYWQNFFHVLRILQFTFGAHPSLVFAFVGSPRSCSTWWWVYLSQVETYDIYLYISIYLSLSLSFCFN